MPASVRSFWKGHLGLSPVTIPVRLVTATLSDAAVSFHKVDRKTKQRVLCQMAAPGVDEADPLNSDRPYHLLHDGAIAEEGHRVIREALPEEDKAGLGQLTLRSTARRPAPRKAAAKRTPQEPKRGGKTSGKTGAEKAPRRKAAGR